MEINIGQHNGAALRLDLARLVDTRMLIQANSGGGKSWLLRLICERAAGKLQTIVLDPEGEFATLRERVDMALVGNGGELATDVRSASLLARKLVEVGISAVVDLYDLKLHDRREFVRRFIESLMSVKRDLWHPLLVIIDEAHLFAPEKSAGESVATDAVIALMSQGRKRGFAGILSTQRLSKLHKDAAAEANNVVIGRTWLDVDQQRAGDLLGMDKASRQGLRDLEPGQFFSFGPAFSTHGVVRFQSDKVSTTHPKAGERHTMTAPKASEKIRDIVSQIGDLPKQAEEEARTIDELRADNARLKRELAAKPAPVQVAPKVERVEVPVMPADVLAAYKEMQDAIIAMWDDFRAAQSKVATAATKLDGSIGRAKTAAPVVRTASPPTPLTPATASVGRIQRQPVPGREVPGNAGLSKAERSILTALAQYPQGRSKRQVAILTSYAVNGGGFNNAISSLVTRGYVVRFVQDVLNITDAGVIALGDWTPLPRGAQLLAHWMRQLSKAERAALEVIAAAWPNAISKADVADATNYAVDGGGFNNAISRLRTLELVGGRSELKASDELFD